MPAILAASNLCPDADEAMRQGAVAASARRLPLLLGHLLPESFGVQVLLPHEAGVAVEATLTTALSALEQATS